ncbi:hypothetical protein [Spirosoma aerolatum]|uniref:hypothetical protein n=1 Tax=Spirosoma aerolatum TaxID=1211326 RepID=UPI0009AE3C28|nr:hypothetical protein [Spirosoma aerolatum]
MKKERFLLILANCLLFAVACFFLTSCLTYQKALRKFGHLAKDSATVVVTDTLITKKDSVVLRLKTDTTTVHQVIQEGRARIIYDRTHTITQVKAECLPDTIIREIQANCPPVASFGIAPWYRLGFWIAIGVLAVCVLIFLLSYIFKLSISKR